MTLEEFKAWLEGFTRGDKDFTPTKEEWEKIKEKIGKIQKAIELNSFPNISPSQWPTIRNPLEIFPGQTICTISLIGTSGYMS